ncbi:hypothetical protein CsSME_00043584 [Camellia sinensis var. sinensis]
MADDIPYGGGPPYAEDEPDIVSLPPRIRLFVLEEYDPEEHILPSSTFYHFTNFARWAPADLLLREPESHLSHHTHEPPREYTEGLLGVVASLKDMVLRRETMLCASGIQIPPLRTGPSRPFRAARRGVSACGRGGRRAPVRQDDESSEEEESTHL